MTAVVVTAVFHPAPGQKDQLVEALREAVAPYVSGPATVTTMTAIPVGGAAGIL